MSKDAKTIVVHLVKSRRDDLFIERTPLVIFSFCFSAARIAGPEHIKAFFPRR
jgi:hypothetical protein